MVFIIGMICLCGHLFGGLLQATTSEYKAYQEQVLTNCSKFAEV